jgi:hypothetical protein
VRGFYPANYSIAKIDIRHSATLLDAGAEGARVLKQHRIKICPPNLETLPRSAIVRAKGFKAPRTAPFDPQTRMARSSDGRKTRANTKLHK